MTSLGEIGEAGLIRRLLPHLGRQGGELVIGPGEDDTAAWREGDGTFTVATCDAMVEGIHFDFRWLPPREVGWRALALALGDLAAKGATPTYGLVTLSAPSSWTLEAALAFYGGMAELAGRVGLTLAGGDTTSSPGPVAVSVTVLGRTARRPLGRSVAQAGWAVAVTGRLGAAAAGLEAAMAARPLLEDWEQALRRPLPRLQEGEILAAAGLCCGDISDGLLRELEKFGESAGVGAVIRLQALPLARGVDAVLAVASGEEVELVCVGPPQAVRDAAGSLRCGLTVVGELTPGGEVVAVDQEGVAIDVGRGGHQHFA